MSTTTATGCSCSRCARSPQIAAASDVARDAADVIVLDDDLSSIVTAIEHGRLAYTNIKKTVAYSLSHAMPELLPIFLDLG